MTDNEALAKINKYKEMLLSVNKIKEIELPVYKVSYELLLYGFKLIKNITREYKYTIEEKLK